MSRAITLLAALFVIGCGPKGPNQPPPLVTPDDDPLAQPAPGEGGLGSLPGPKVEELSEFFTKKGIHVSRCYQAELERRGDRSLVGKVTVKLKIGKDGTASSVRIIQTTLNTPAVESCIVEAIQEWALPELPNEITWTWTYEFQPAW